MSITTTRYSTLLHARCTEGDVVDRAPYTAPQVYIYMQMVMDLKEIVSRLRKENRSLTNAFVWLCSGNADWQTLVRTLPQKLCDKLPGTVPLLLAGPPKSAPPDISTPDSGNFPNAEETAPPATELPGTPTVPACSEPSRRRNRSLCHQRRSHSKNAVRPGSSRRAGRQVDKPPFDNSNGKHDNITHSLLERFPELAALESEFQDLVSRPAIV